MNDFDYKTFRTAAAINILCALISSPKINIIDNDGNEIPFNKSNAIESAIDAADSLIKKLKETEEKENE